MIMLLGPSLPPTVGVLWRGWCWPRRGAGRGAGAAAGRLCFHPGNCGGLATWRDNLGHLRAAATGTWKLVAVCHAACATCRATHPVLQDREAEAPAQYRAVQVRGCLCSASPVVAPLAQTKCQWLALAEPLNGCCPLLVSYSISASLDARSPTAPPWRCCASSAPSLPRCLSGGRWAGAGR